LIEVQKNPPKWRVFLFLAFGASSDKQLQPRSLTVFFVVFSETSKSGYRQKMGC
jgi:hypothetical protein